MEERRVEWGGGEEGDVKRVNERKVLNDGEEGGRDGRENGYGWMDKEVDVEYSYHTHICFGITLIRYHSEEGWMILEKETNITRVCLQYFFLFTIDLSIFFIYRLLVFSFN